MPVGEDFAPPATLEGAVERPRGGIAIGDLESLERDIVIARSIAAADTRYEKEPFEPCEELKKRKIGGDHYNDPERRHKR
jgi:hypothetical protein